MSHRVSRHTVHARSRIDLLDAINRTQLLCADLPRCGLLIRTYRRKSKRAARAHSEYAADDSLLSHTQADERMFVALRLQELHYGDVVGKSGRSSNDLVVVGGNR